MKINKVTLYSHSLDEMLKFYVDELGFELRAQTNASFEITIGDSVLEVKDYHPQEKPYYHFAINIPTNLFTSAKKWAKSKVELMKEDGEDEVYFTLSDAHSFYFSDPSGNIVEFISRYAVSPKSPSKTFSVQESLCISEINLTTDKVGFIGNKLNSLGLPVRKAEAISEGRLNFIGQHEAGSFLLLGPRKRRWFFSNRVSETFPLSIVIDDQLIISLNREGEMKVESAETNLG
ncbi:VOC family protein [Peribacillus muralis]|uniref:VOC family protein n=1 Tax=Peribacillus muralis TaxID=264697 RepID=UPI003D0790CE